MILPATAIAGWLIVAAPSPAQAAPVVEGYVWANQPATPSYLVATGYEYNSAGQPIKIVRAGVGSYQVRFVGMAAAGGVAHASAHGSGNSDFCVVGPYGPRGDDQIVQVRCFDGDGDASDSLFVANFTNRRPAGSSYGYLWSSEAVPPIAGYKPPAKWAYDSAGEPIVITRTMAGRYLVQLGALTDTVPADYWNGYFRATAYGSSPLRCEVLDPGLQNPPAIPVNCYDITGAGIDSRFTLTYALEPNILGDSPPHGTAIAHPDPMNPPSLGGWSNPGGAPTVSELAEGSYVVSFPGLAAPHGHAMASAFGTPPAYCNIAAWWPSGGAELVKVNCYDAATHELTPVYAFNVSFTH